MYVIVSDKVFSDKLAYLIWQPGCWDDGWTWTFKECVKGTLPDSFGNHRFIFTHKEDAWRKIRDLRLTTGYVIKLRREDLV